MGKALSEERYGCIEASLPGFYVVSALIDDINNNGLLDETGELLIPCERSAYNLVNEFKEDGSEGKFIFPWNNPTEKVSVDCSYFTTVAPGLIVGSGKPNVLFDCFSGETLLTADRISFANERYIYAEVDGVTHVFELSLE